MTNALFSLIQTAQVLPSADPNPLPAQPLIFMFLQHLTFTLHFLFMFATVGGAAFLTFVTLTDGSGQEKMRSFLARLLPISLAFTVTLGVAPLLFVQVLYGQIFFTTSILMGWWWLLSLGLLMLAYYGLYLFQLRQNECALTRRFAPLASTALLLLFALVLVMNFNLFFRYDQWWQIHQDTGNLFLNLDQPLVPASWINYMLWALAAGGLLAAIHGWASKRRDPGYAYWAVKTGGVWFAAFMVLQIIQSFWLAGLLPAASGTGEILGSSLLANLATWGTVAVAALAAALMLWAALGRIHALPVTVSCLLVVVGIVLIAMRREAVRQTFLADLEGFDIGGMVVNPQWDTIGLFAVLLVAGLVIVAWMLVAIVRGKGAEPLGD